ncbi:FeoB-associated Cys-rich membrane protein [Evansella sp. AB-rgal1]|uniref:FeoB-associated Cys-rich membrane protein n=1 Tax=Evansella sp. AB-rgal1 TaxID=3242696 RepID=UPI00359EEDD4
MIASWILGILIFGYAGYAFYKHIEKSKEGKCAKCDVNKECSIVTDCCSGVDKKSS